LSALSWGKKIDVWKKKKREKGLMKGPVRMLTKLLTGGDKEPDEGDAVKVGTVG